MLTSCICGKELEPGMMRCAECQAAYEDQAVEDAWIAPDPDMEISDHHWLECEAVNEAWRAEQQAREDEARTVAQQSAAREPVRQPVNGWPGRKVRKAKGRRNG